MITSRQEGSDSHTHAIGIYAVTKHNLLVISLTQITLHCICLFIHTRVIKTIRVIRVIRVTRVIRVIIKVLLGLLGLLYKGH